MTSLRLVLVGETRDVEGLPRFLELAGSSLTRLSLSSIPWADFDVRQVLSSCPHLKSLSVTGIDASTGSFLQAYRVSKARIEELDCWFDSFSKLARELANKHTRLARTLRRLTCQFPGVWSYKSERHATALIEMLGKNRTLEVLYVLLPHVAFNMLSGDFKTLHDQEIPMAREPFPLECHLAFLSIFASSRRQREQRGAKQTGLGPADQASASTSSVFANFSIDFNVMAIIFSFAAACTLSRGNPDTSHQTQLLSSVGQHAAYMSCVTAAVL